MTIEQIHHCIDEAASEPSVGMVVFSGGEPTLLGKQLFEAISYAHAKGLKTRVVSNAHWATTPERALSMIDKLMQSGLTEINFSLSDYHQPFVPTERVCNGLRAANNTTCAGAQGRRVEKPKRKFR